MVFFLFPSSFFSFTFFFVWLRARARDKNKHGNDIYTMLASSGMGEEGLGGHCGRLWGGGGLLLPLCICLWPLPAAQKVSYTENKIKVNGKHKIKI